MPIQKLKINQTKKIITIPAKNETKIERLENGLWILKQVVATRKKPPIINPVHLRQNIKTQISRKTKRARSGRLWFPSFSSTSDIGVVWGLVSSSFDIP